MKHPRYRIHKRDRRLAVNTGETDKIRQDLKEALSQEATPFPVNGEARRMNLELLQQKCYTQNNSEK